MERNTRKQRGKKKKFSLYTGTWKEMKEETNVELIFVCLYISLCAHIVGDEWTPIRITL